MTNWHIVVFLLFLVGFLLCFAYALWLRYRMRSSKARFALASIGALTSSLSMTLTAITGNILDRVADATLGYMGISSSTNIADPNLIALLCAVAGCTLTYFLYRFSVSTIRSWNGPVTLAVNELAKEKLDNNLMLLAVSELRRQILLKSDPLASEVAVNWQQKLTDAPAAPQWHILAKELIEGAFSEAFFQDNAWRDRYKAWIGQIYSGHRNYANTMPLIVFVFNDEPSEFEIKTSVSTYKDENGSIAGTTIYCVYDSEHVNDRDVEIEGTDEVRLWSRGALTKMGLKLTGYARELIRRFDVDTLGGTSATLRETFIDPHVIQRGTHERARLDTLISKWMKENSRRHLTIVGEYGQGKSTAMLSVCVKWARNYLANGAPNEKIPLLIELRGKSPADTDLLSSWASRYELSVKQVRNLIRSGNAVVILEGFDELKNAGREYDRHEHFNALWRLAFPGTKLIFTGRPNFFLDEAERNRSLRTENILGAVGDAFTEVWTIARLEEDEIRRVVLGFGQNLGESIMDAAGTHPSFFEIISRPSMLPVVATIWSTIKSLQGEGHDLTGGVILKHYLNAIYLRKEAEIQRQELESGKGSASYLLLPTELRQAFALGVTWKMAGDDSRNTIRRNEFNSAVERIYSAVFRAFQITGAPPQVVDKIRRFEEQHREETKADKLDRVCNEVATAAVFVSDPAGGPSNLRLPHKQYYEYMISSAAFTIVSDPRSEMTQAYKLLSGNPYINLLNEPNSIAFFAELTKPDFRVFRTFEVRLGLALLHATTRFGKITKRRGLLSRIDQQIAQNRSIRLTSPLLKLETAMEIYLLLSIVMTPFALMGVIGIIWEYFHGSLLMSKPHSYFIGIASVITFGFVGFASALFRKTLAKIIVFRYIIAILFVKRNKEISSSQKFTKSINLFCASILSGSTVPK